MVSWNDNSCPNGTNKHIFQYFLDRDDSKVCACGYPLDQHSRRSAIVNMPTMSSWNVTGDTRRTFTNAFGEIEFVGYEDVQRKASEHKTENIDRKME